MRFRNSNPQTPYLNKRDQIRMLKMVGLLTLVLVLVKLAADPGNWGWWNRITQAETQTETKADAKQQPVSQMKTEPGQAPLKPGEVRVVANEPEEKPFQLPENLRNLTKEGSLTQIDEQHLSVLKDDYGTIGAKEAPIYWATLALTRELPPEELEKAAREGVAYKGLRDQPDFYRGTLITIEGNLRLVNALPAMTNDHKIGPTYEAWIWTADSGDRPYRVIVMTIPEDIPTGEPLKNPMRVKVTGYFLKRFGYPRQGGGSQIAPMLLANQLYTVETKPISPANDSHLVWIIAGFGGGIAFIIALMMWRFQASDRAFEQSHLKRLTEAPEDAIESLEGVPTETADEFFQSLEGNSPAKPEA